MRLDTFEVNYQVANGDKSFDKMQVSGVNNTCMVQMEGINSEDSSIELHQSIDGENWGFIDESLKTLSSTQPSHTWNVRGLINGAFLRVVFKKGTATAGTIQKIKLLSDG